ncbi:hypothetical protein [Novipirellula caenicola]|uniref:Uncharacterized protein n=1 Tax=Novipirellula caenicola TaxID=1536901 RepID=A0ABP9W1I2_9BACT
MNPYESTVVNDGTRPISRFVLWFSIAALLAYFGSMVMRRGLDTVIIGYAQVPLGAAVESLIILSVAGFSGWLASFEIDKSVPGPSIRRRLVGGVAFGVGFVNCQLYVFPYIRGMLSVLSESTPLDPIVHGLFDQPYVLLPTVLFAGVCGWIVERLSSNFTRRLRSDEQRHERGAADSAFSDGASTAAARLCQTLPD